MLGMLFWVYAKDFKIWSKFLPKSGFQCFLEFRFNRLHLCIHEWLLCGPYMSEEFLALQYLSSKINCMKKSWIFQASEVVKFGATKLNYCKALGENLGENTIILYAYKSIACSCYSLVQILLFQTVFEGIFNFHFSFSQQTAADIEQPLNLKHSSWPRDSCVRGRIKSSKSACSASMLA